MRADLGVGYADLKVLPAVRGVWRVIVSGWGGAPDPEDITAYVRGLSVTSALRDASQGASITLDNSDLAFDLEAGSRRAMVTPGGCTINIEIGDRDEFGVCTYHQVFRGGPVEGGLRYSTTDKSATVQLGVRGRDILGLQITSPQYGVPPATWQANDIITDLFVRFAGFTDPDDFDLAALDFAVSGAQFENEGLAAAAGACLQPKNYRLWFGYDGRLCSGPLLPAVWTPVMTVEADPIDEFTPTRSLPAATRIQVAGGPSSTAVPIIGEPILLGRSRYAYDHNSGNRVLGGQDCIYYELAMLDPPPPLPGSQPYAARYVMAGPKEQLYRQGGCVVANLAFTHGGIGDFIVPPGIEADSDVWDPITKWFTTRAYWETIHDGGLWIDFTFETWGHPLAWSNPAIDAQAWNDALITAFGDIKKTVQAKLAMTYEDADNVAQAELIFAQKAMHSGEVPLRHCDLRIEPGDVITVETRDGSYDLWVQEVTFGLDSANQQTRLRGFVV